MNGEVYSGSRSNGKLEKMSKKTEEKARLDGGRQSFFLFVFSDRHYLSSQSWCALLLPRSPVGSVARVPPLKVTFTDAAAAAAASAAV